jgi:hypothetical protein
MFLTTQPYHGWKLIVLANFCGQEVKSTSDFQMVISTVEYTEWLTPLD